MLWHMIPRFRPMLGFAEVAAALTPGCSAVAEFERSLAARLGCEEGIAFEYGRTALLAFFQSVGLQGAEVIIPGYTCSVVAHAVTLSGNIPTLLIPMNGLQHAARAGRIRHFRTDRGDCRDAFVRLPA